MFYEPSHLPKAYTNPPKPMPNLPQWQPAPTWQPPIAQPLPTVAPTLRRPGCVSLTALALLILSFISGLGALCSLALFDPLNFIGGLSYAIILVIMIVGLWQMYRWAVNMMILFCVATIFRALASAIVSVTIVDNYGNNLQVESLHVGFLLMAILIPIFAGLVLGWYSKTRKFFLPNTIFPKWEQTLYIVTVAVFILNVMLSLAQIPEVYEIYRTSG